jgi:hypothetical protein
VLTMLTRLALEVITFGLDPRIAHPTDVTL